MNAHFEGTRAAGLCRQTEHTENGRQTVMSRLEIENMRHYAQVRMNRNGVNAVDAATVATCSAALCQLDGDYSRADAAAFQGVPGIDICPSRHF